MGRRLIEQEAVFREVIERCDRAMRPYGDWSLLAELSAPDGATTRLNEIDVIQPALFAIQVALAALWRSWGIEPHSVVGHSLGEVAAAHVAGALSFEDAVAVMCHRSRLFKRAVGQGAMAAVELSIDEARRALAGSEDRVSIAVSNSPTSTVLSGEPAALGAIVDRLQRGDIFCRMLKVDFASHSPQMEPLRADLLDALQALKPRDEALPIYSTVTGGIGRGLDFDAHYWVRNMREPVLFSTAVQRLMEDGHDIFLEISPHPTLLSAMQQGFHDLGQDSAVLPSLRRDEDERAVMLGSLGALYSLGCKVDWDLIHPSGGRCVQLPLYPWQRERCWFEPSARDTDARRAPASRGGVPGHPLLGRHFQSSHPAEHSFLGKPVRQAIEAYLDDHLIQGVAVLPAAAYLEMAFAAAAEVFGTQSVALQKIEFRKALFLPEGGSQKISSDPLSGSKRRSVLSHPWSPGRRDTRRQNMGPACDRQDSTLSRTTAQSLPTPGGRRSRSSKHDAQRTSRARNITSGFATAASTTVRSSKVSSSCGAATARCWGGCRRPMRRRRASMVVQFIRQFSTQGYRFSAPRSRRKRPKRTVTESICQPASIRSGFTPDPAVTYGVAPGCGIARPMPLRETYSSSMKRDGWRSRSRDSASTTSARTPSARPSIILTTGSMNLSGSRKSARQKCLPRQPAKEAG